MFKTLSANVSGTVRRAYKDGRQYLVAPLTLLREGVLAGSKGALFYPRAEIGRNVQDWEGMPLTLGHPKRQGTNVSASSPGVRSIGYVRRPVLRRQSALGAEGWFDVEATTRADPSLIEDIERGASIELSTGLYTDNQPAPVGASFGGVGYSAIARNYRPDHVAILRGVRGACSVEDGCGVNITNSKVDQMMDVIEWLRAATEEDIERATRPVRNVRELDDEPTLYPFALPAMNCECGEDDGMTTDGGLSLPALNAMRDDRRVTRPTGGPRPRQQGALDEDGDYLPLPGSR